MNKYKFPFKSEKDYVEAEIVEERESIVIEKKNLFRTILEKLGKIAFFLFFAGGFLLIFIGSILCATIIGAIIGVFLIILGMILIITGIRVYFSLASKRIY